MPEGEAGDGAGTGLMTGAAGSPETPAWIAEHEFSDDAVKMASKYTSLSDWANGAVNAQKLLGRSITMPADDGEDDARDEQMGKIYSKLGRPDAAIGDTGYKLEKPENIPDGLAWSDDAAGAVKELAYGMGLNQSQFDKIVAFDLERQTKAIAAGKQANDADMEKMAAQSKLTLQGRWSASNYEVNLANAQKAYEKYGGPELMELFDKLGIKNHPAVAGAFHAIHTEKMAEGTLVKGDGGATVEKKGAIVYNNSPDLKR